jgi:hypothetical protein
MTGGAFGGGRPGIGRVCMSVLGVVMPVVMGVVSGCGFDGMGSAGCGSGVCCSCGIGPCSGGGGAGVLGTTTAGGVEYDTGAPQAAGLGILKVGTS